MRAIYVLLLLVPFFLKAQPQIELLQFATGFNSPVDITHAGDNRLFVVERSGIIKIVEEDGTVFSTPFLDIENLVHAFGGQGEIGLLGLVFHPDYTNNGYFYVHYTNNDDNSNISRFQVSATDPNEADPGSEMILMTIDQPFLNHNGGCLKFGPDGYLYIGLGDGGSSGDPGNRAQNLNEVLGKMLRIDVNNGAPYSIPADNPYVNDPDANDLIWAVGLRNPWRYSFDRLTGDLWIGDVGQGQREEIDFQQASSTGGENYGWKCYEGNSVYSTSGCTSASNYDAPVFEYAHNGTTHCSVTGGYVYRGGLYQDLQGYYFYADYCSGKMWAILKTGNTFTNYEVGDFLGYDISTFGEGVDGELYVARLGNGRIYKLASIACTGFSLTSVETIETCAGQEDGAIDVTVMNGSGSYTYSWSNGAETEDISNLNAGIYTVTIADSDGCNIIESIEVISGTPVDPIVQADGSTDICLGELVTLVANDLPVGYTYQWFSGANELNGQTNQSLAVFTSGEYYVTITGDVCGEITTPSNWVTVNVDTTMTTPFVSVIGPLSFCSGFNTELTTSPAPSDYTIQWYDGNGALAGENGESLIVTNSGAYYAIYDGLCPTESSNWTEITVDQSPPDAVFTYDGDNTFCEGESVTLTSNIAPNGYAYEWYRNGMLINGVTSFTLTVTESGVYSVTFVGDCPEDGDFEEEFTVLPNPNTPIITIAMDSIIASPGNFQYTWLFNNNPVSTTDDNFFVPLESGNYQVQITDENGCTAISESIEFIISSLSEIGLSDLNINPNPFNQDVSIAISFQDQTDLEIEIFNSAGQSIRLYQEHIISTTWNQTFDLSDQPSGIYFLKIKTKEGTLSRKLVKS